MSGNMKTAADARQYGVVRGGRVTKLNGRDATCSPVTGLLFSSGSSMAMAAAAVIALPTMFGGATSANAQAVCTLTAPGVYDCAATNNDPTTDTSQVIATNGEPLVVNVDADVTVDTVALGAGDAFDLSSTGAGGSVTFVQAADGAALSGAANGITAYSEYGDIDMTVTGALTGATVDGLSVTNAATADDIAIDVADVTGAIDGIAVTNFSATGGDTTIMSSGTVTGEGGDGIIVNNVAGSGAITVDVTNVSGYYDGIEATNNGTGALSITATGDITSLNGDGVIATNSDNGTDLVIDVNTVTGAEDGIEASNSGAGVLSITATGDVVGESYDGINANADADSTGLTIDAAGVSGGEDGIDAEFVGTGDLTIMASGNVNADSGNGVAALNDGDGMLFVDVDGAITAGMDGVLANNYGTDLTVEVGAVTADDYGVAAYNYGTGAVSVTATGDVAAYDGAGIRAVNSISGTDLMVDATNVYGILDGIWVENYGSGALSVTATGDVTGELVDGIHASNENGTSLTISAVNVTGGNDGIDAENNGTGALTVTATGDVTGEDGDGIMAYNSSAGTDLVIDAATVTGYDNGISADNDGSGMLSITASGTVTGEYGDGITARNVYGTDLLIDVADVSGYVNGIDARNVGSGELSITASGDVSGTEGSGIDAYNDGTDLTIDVASVSGGYWGIEAENFGSGALSITASGEVVGEYGRGVSALNSAGTDLTIDVASVTGASDGISANNGGSGELSITASGDVTGENGTGILASNSINGTDLTIDAANVTGSANGIDADNDGSGNLTVTSTGTVTGVGGYGIVANNSVNGGDLSVTAVNVYGDEEGIVAINSGDGMTEVTATGTVEGDSGYGIRAVGQVNTTDLTVTANDVTGGFGGIVAYQYGSGAVTVTSTGSVVGENGAGIDVTNTNGTDLLIEAVDVDGATTGIAARHDGSGSATVIATGDVVGGTGAGIYARNSVGTFLTIEANNVTGAGRGILANNNGTGALTVTTTGDVIGESQDGIDVYNSSAGTDLTVNAYNVTGATRGIEANNEGSGALSITATGTVTGEGDDGIYAYNSPNGESLTIDVATVNGADEGIEADNQGAGDLTIMASGDVVGETGSGIIASNEGEDLVIDVAAVTGEVDGIDAGNDGIGMLSITASGDVTGTTGDGIVADNSISGTDLMIDAAAVTGGNAGIYAQNYGSGELSITASGDVTGMDSDGIRAFNSAAGTDLTIDVAAVTGADDGIQADNDGTGATTIMASGTITAEYGDGINVDNTAAGTDLTVDVAAVYAYDDGIDASNDGTGALTIMASGDIVSQYGDGIDADNSANGTDLTIDVAGVSGYDDGIDADNNGTGALTIMASGDVTGEYGEGIDAFNSVNGTDLTIDVASVSGYEGIYANNNGTGALTITASGEVVGTGYTYVYDGPYGTFTDYYGNGISAFNSANGTDLTIDVVDVTGNADGINAGNQGSGDLTITSTGTISGNDYGIEADTGSGSGAITIEANNVYGGYIDGIDVDHYGSGTLSVTTTGTVTGDSWGIDADIYGDATEIVIEVNNVSGNDGGVSAGSFGTYDADISITTNGTVEATSTYGNAVEAFSGADGSISVTNSGTLNSSDTGYAVYADGAATTVSNSGTINGMIRLSDYADTVTNSGTFNADMMSLLGDGDDVFNNSGTLNLSADQDFGLGDDTFNNSGDTVVDGDVTLLGLETASNSGLITMIDGSVDDMLTIPGDYVGAGGTLGVDVDFSTATADLLVVGGSATGSTLVDLNPVNDSAFQFGDTILIVDAGDGSTAGAFSIGADSEEIGFLSYDVQFVAADNDYVLATAPSTGAFRTARIAAGASELWYRSADAWAAQMAASRGSMDRGFWINGYGISSSTDDDVAFSGAFDRTFGLSYDQDFFGAQAGFDFGSGGTRFGLTGGLLSSDLRFDGSPDGVDYMAYNIGAYAALDMGRLFANVLAKYDFIDADVKAPEVGYAVDLDGDAYGIRGEVGFHGGNGSFFFEPVASLEYQKTDLDGYEALNTDVDFDGFDGLRGMAGLRVGTTSSIGNGNLLTLYAGGHAVHEFEGGNDVTLTIGTSTFETGIDERDTFGRGELGVKIDATSGVAGFFEGTADFGGDYEAWGLRGGISFQF